VARRLRIDGVGAPLVTVAGTNGKGSSVSYLEALALAHGLTPGCYVSPHLLRYNESVRIGGQPVSDAVLCEAFARVEAARQGEALTAFESRTLAAMLVLRAARPDLMILEVGLGGRLDAVNLFDPDVALITAVGLDHREWLGGTREAVAREKAGIMRPGRPAVCSDPGSVELLAPLARERSARALMVGADFRYGLAPASPGAAARWGLRIGARCFRDLPPPALAGRHQYANAAGAVVAFSVLTPSPRGLEEDALRQALTGVRAAGRLQRLEGLADAWVDVAHNPHAAGALAEWLAGGPPADAVCAMYADKDVEGTLAAVAPRVARWHLAGLPPPRGAPAARLAAAVEAVAPAAPARRYADVAAAWAAARGCAEGGGRVLAFGSFETCRRVLRLERSGASLDT
jgi:dihydrofolate synthase/folylpolyglutamate synthase